MNFHKLCCRIPTSDHPFLVQRNARLKKLVNRTKLDFIHHGTPKTSPTTAQYSNWQTFVWFTKKITKPCRTFQPQASTPGFSIPDFSTMNSLTPGWLQVISTSDFSTWTFQHQRGLGLRSSWLKNLGLRSPGLKLGVETPGVGMCCNHFYIPTYYLHSEIIYFFSLTNIMRSH